MSWQIAIILGFICFNIAGNASLFAGDLLSDDFNSSTTENNPSWRFHDPYDVTAATDPGQSILSLNNANALIRIPAGLTHDLWTNGSNRAPRLLQPAEDKDFDIEVKFESFLSSQYQIQGIVVQQSDNIFLRFDVVHDGTSPHLFAAYVNNTDYTAFANQTLSASPRYLRVSRSGNQWIYKYSYDGVAWNQAADFNRALSVTEVGFFAGTHTPCPDFQASIDYFMNLANPIVDNDNPGQGSAQIDAWYGNARTVGQNGNPQKWVNVLGNVVSPEGLSSLTYSLNGGPDRILSVGPEAPDGLHSVGRLTGDGDFNIELDCSSLIDGVNAIVIKATDSLGLITSNTVIINYSRGIVRPFPYTADWSVLTDINSVDQLAHVVDGLWSLTPEGIRTVQFGYDRSIAVGDMAWPSDYEVTAPIHIHSDFSGIGFAVGWQGHEGVYSPKTEWPLEALAWLRGPLGSSTLNISTYGGISGWEHVLATKSAAIAPNGSYMLKARSESLGGGISKFYVKIWPQGSSEPTGWDLSADVPTRAGSVLLLAYNADVTFGNVSIASLLNTVPPVIIAQPAGRSVAEGQTATFTVAATGTPTLSYQWLRNGTNIVGATSSSYTTPATTPADSGASFACIVGNAGGSVASNPAILTVTASAPVITAQPASQSVGAGQTATFSVSVVGSGTITYRWQRNGADISGAAGNSYTTPATALSDDGASFVCIVSNAVGSIASIPAILTVASTGGSLLSDDFNPATNEPNPAWRFYDPYDTTSANDQGQSALSFDGANASIGIPAGLSHDLWSSSKAPRLLQHVENTDFGIEVKFESQVAAQYQIQGIVVQQSDDKALRFDIVHDGISPRLFAAYVSSDNLIVHANSTLTAAPLYLRVLRLGNQWTYRYSYDGASWINGAAFTQDISVTEAGFFAGNHTPNPAFTAGIDYFMNLALPVTDIDPLDPTAPPIITTQPVSQTVQKGQTATFRTSAIAAGTLSYQWERNGADIPGATGASYTTPATAAADNGAAFTCTIGNGAGSATSQTAYLTVAGITLPSIISQPADQTVTAGQIATFSVAATGGTLSYQWQRNGTVIEGAIGAFYTTPQTTSADNGDVFACVVNNDDGSVTSNPAALTIIALTPPEIAVQPANQAVTAGQTATFSVTATGEVPSYQWQRNGTDIEGATNASYTTPPTVLADNGESFACTISNNAGSVTSNAALLTVAPGMPTILSDDFNPATTEPNPEWRFYDPYDTTPEADPGESVLSHDGSHAIITVPEGFPHDLWIEGRNQAARLLQPAPNTNFGIEAKFDSILTSEFQMQGIVVQQTNRNFLRFEIFYQAGTQHLFAAYVDGDNSTVFTNTLLEGAPSYLRIVRSGDQWTCSYSSDGAVWTDGAVFDRIMTVTEVGFFAGNYYPNPALTADVDYFTSLAAPPDDGPDEEAIPPAIAVQPAAQTVSAGQTATFSVAATGSETLSYQWQRNGTDIVGANGASYTTPATASADNGALFNCVVSNSAGSAASQQALLTVITINPPAIATQPANKSVTEGQTATFRVVATGSEILSYQWQRNGINISGATGASYTTPATVLSDSGASFTCSIGNSAGSVTSNAALLTVSPANYSLKSDDFNPATTESNPTWRFYDPYDTTAANDPGQSTLSFDGANALIGIPAGLSHDLWGGNNKAPRILQTTENKDLEIEVKFSSQVSAQYQIQGIVVQQTNNTLLRFDVIHDGSAPRIFAAYVNGDTAAALINQTLSTAPLYLRVLRSGNQWTYRYSYDGASWTDAGVFTQNLNVTEAGFFGGNHTPSPAFIAAAEYFLNLSAPNEPDPLEPPAIAAQPADITVAAGQTAAFSVAATGDETLSYRWQKNGVDIPGATGASYITPATALADNGAVFVCIVSNEAGDAVSNPATLTVEPGIPTILSDDFNPATPELNPDWRFFDPYDTTAGDDPGQSSLSFAGGNALISVPEGLTHNLWVNDFNKAPRLLQSAPNSDFGIEVKFASQPSLEYQMQGIVVQQTDNTFLRFELNFKETSPRLFVAYVDSDEYVVFNNIELPAAPSYMQVIRSGNQWTYRYSNDRIDWTDAGSFEQIMAVTEVGFYGGNHDPNPAFTAEVNYFMNLASPVAESGSSEQMLPPAVVSQPANQTVTEGQSATFSVTATGDGTLSYQWKRNGTIVAGATDASYTTQAAALADNGAVFTCSVSNIAGSVTSQQAVLTVTSIPLPVIATQPASLSVAEGQTATFTAAATGDGILTYQWKRDGVDISGANENSYTTPATVLADNGASFTCVVSNSSGDVTSEQAILTVTAIPLPVIAAQPADQSVAEGQTATFSVTATGEGTLSYQWQRNGIDISGATGASYTTPATTSADNGASFACTVRNSSGSVVSNQAILTVTATVSDWRFFDPYNTTAGNDSGESTVSYDNGNPSIGVPAGLSHDLWGGNNKAPRLLQTVENSNLDIEVKFGTQPSAQYQIQGIVIQQTNDKLLRFDIVHDGASPRLFAAYVDGDTATSLVGQAISNTPLYLRVLRLGDQWTYRYSYDGANWSQAGTFTQAMTVTEAGFFAGNHTPSPAFTSGIEYFRRLTAPEQPAAPSITSQPANQFVEPGQTATFSVAATGGTLSYQWKRNGTDIAGATGASYTTPATSTADSGASFTCAVSNSAGSVTSAAAALIVSSGQSSWWNSAWRYRIPVDVNAAAYQRTDKPVNVPMNFTQFLASLGVSGSLVENSIRVVEVNEAGVVMDANVPFQFDKSATYNAANNADGTLVFMLGGTTAADATRHFHIYFETSGSFTAPSFTSRLSIADNVPYEGQDSFRIATPSGSYYYHKQGAGFARMEDINGNDWIGYRPGDRAAGEFRGIPNLGAFGHPGYTNASSSILSQGPLKATIASQSNDGQWKLIWDFYPQYATMTLQKAGGNYWMLYEGTPGGQLNPATDYWVRSSGERLTTDQTFGGDIASPEWVYFGDAAMSRYLYLAHHEDDSAEDQYYQMENNMTVFGFGRQYQGVDKYLSAVPSHLTIGFGEQAANASTVINDAFRDLNLSIGAVEYIGGPITIPPSILTQPPNQAVGEGNAATFSVTAAGTAPLSYQWQKNGVDIQGATGASYTTPAVTQADSGSTFRCRVTNPYGSVLSNPATLAISAAVTLLDVDYTHTTDVVWLPRTPSGLGFSFFDVPAGIPSNLVSPIDYSQGTVYNRIEVLSKPSANPVEYQMCIFQDQTTADKHACAGTIPITGTGVLEWSQPLPSYFQFANIDWSRELYLMMLVMKDKNGIPIDNRYGYEGRWFGSPDFSLYYPMHVRYRAVLVPPGGNFAGW